jgi:tight adherence protein B
VIAIVAAGAALGLVVLFDGLTATTPQRAAGLRSRLQRLAGDTGLSAAAGARLGAASVGGACVTFIGVAGTTSSVVTAAVVAGAAAWSPFALLRGRAAKRRRQRRETWPDALATLIAGVRAGLSLPESCAALVERGPDEVRAGFAAFATTYRASGSFDAGLERLRSELSDPIADRVAVALATAHDVGGTDLVRVLRTLADFVREDLRIRREIEARWSWTVTAARVAAAAPWIVLLLMSSRPEAAAAYNSRAGVAVIGGGIVATIVGYRLMLSAARLPEQARLSE